MSELTFQKVLEIYKYKLFNTKLRYSRQLISEEVFKAEWNTTHFWLSELKEYFYPYYQEYTEKDFSEEDWAFLQERYGYKEDKPYALIVYRGVVIPMLSDDYGQQDYTVIFGEARGGGAYNFNAADDFCGMVDYYLERDYMKDIDKDWAEETNPLDLYLNN